MKLKDGTAFWPDFWLRDQDCFVIVNKGFLHTDVGRLKASCFIKEKGKVTKILDIGREITKEVEMQKKLQESESFERLYIVGGLR